MGSLFVTRPGSHRRPWTAQSRSGKSAVALPIAKPSAYLAPLFGALLRLRPMMFPSFVFDLGLKREPTEYTGNANDEQMKLVYAQLNTQRSFVKRQKMAGSGVLRDSETGVFLLFPLLTLYGVILPGPRKPNVGTTVWGMHSIGHFVISASPIMMDELE
ncbi:hypothetical protein H2204_011664 [Knufia peltigerae]|uniref:Uncharacterized protein n=1 Tax=Knufia peltigerae TaxID=1002370 RepID=A0AA39CTS6_9EURO|nr:hypothetical protein H2204_011664 [Knufia peltigerae]